MFNIGSMVTLMSVWGGREENILAPPSPPPGEKTQIMKVQDILQSLMMLRLFLLIGVSQVKALSTTGVLGILGKKTKKISFI